jgi:hypothetical protein
MLLAFCVCVCRLPTRKMSNHLIFCWAVPRGSERGCELVYRIGGVEAEERTTIGTTNKKQESLRQSRAAVESLYDIILSRRVSRPWNCYSDSAGGDCWLEVRRNYREGDRKGGGEGLYYVNNCPRFHVGHNSGVYIFWNHYCIIGILLPSRVQCPSDLNGGAICQVLAATFAQSNEIDRPISNENGHSCIPVYE